MKNNNKEECHWYSIRFYWMQELPNGKEAKCSYSYSFTAENDIWNTKVAEQFMQDGIVPEIVHNDIIHKVGEDSKFLYYLSGYEMAEFIDWVCISDLHSSDGWIRKLIDVKPPIKI